MSGAPPTGFFEKSFDQSRIIFASVWPACDFFHDHLSNTDLITPNLTEAKWIYPKSKIWSFVTWHVSLSTNTHYCHLFCVKADEAEGATCAFDMNKVSSSLSSAELLRYMFIYLHITTNVHSPTNRLLFLNHHYISVLDPVDFYNFSRLKAL